MHRRRLRRSVLPERVPAASAGLSLMLAFGGTARDGRPFIISELIAAGTGASAHADGVDCLHTDGSNSMNQPIEALVHGCADPRDALRAAPRLGRRRAASRRARRGQGIRVPRRRHPPHVSRRAALHRGARLAGRRRRAPCRARPSTAPTGASRRSRPRPVTSVSRGDRLIVETAGGGGFGDPRARAPERVAADIANGKVSREAAAARYRASLDD